MAHAPAGPSQSAPVAVAFVTKSAGELHCLLPILALAKEAHPELRIVLVFRNRALRARCAEDRAYSAILDDLGAEALQIRDLAGSMLARRQHVRLVLKDFGPTPAQSPAVLCKLVSPHASLVLFPHAYSLYGAGLRPPAAEARNTRADYDQEGIDALLLNSQLDVEAWANRLPAPKIHVVGAAGYTPWWNAILHRYAREHLADVRARAGDRKLVFLTTRGPHEVYLTEENYRYLVTQAVEVVLKRPDTYLVLKPHPREDVKGLQALLAGFPKDRLEVTGLNTLALASISTLSISFWSSAVLDALAAGTPSIEFYRYHRPNPQTVLDASGRVASIYTTLGLAVGTDSAAGLAEALDAALADRDGLLARQRAALDRCFPDNEAQLGRLRALLEAQLSAPDHGTSAGVAAKGLLRLAQYSAQDLLEQLRQRGHDDD